MINDSANFLPVKKFVIKMSNFVIIHFYGTQNEFVISVNSLYQNSS